jgi:hypothetical protein
MALVACQLNCAPKRQQPTFQHLPKSRHATFVTVAKGSTNCMTQLIRIQSLAPMTRRRATVARRLRYVMTACRCGKPLDQKEVSYEYDT